MVKSLAAQFVWGPDVRVADSAMVTISATTTSPITGSFDVYLPRTASGETPVTVLEGTFVAVRAEPPE